MALQIIFAAVLGLLAPSISLERICNTKECAMNELAKEYLSNMNTSVNPCDDFYQFACGNYASNNPIPDDKSAVSEFSKVKDLVDNRLIKLLKVPIQKNEAKHFQDLKKFYKSCMDTCRIEEIGLNEVKEILVKLGGWPVVEDLNPDIGWECVLYGLRNNYLEANALISLNAVEDPINSTKRILSITKPDTLAQALVKKGKSDKVMKAYYDLMVQTAMAFGAKEETAKQDMDLALDLEIYLANKTKSPEEADTDKNALYNLKTIEQLQMEFPGFRWSDYIETFIPKSLNIDCNTNITLSEPDYTKSLISILKDTPARVIRNYIIWKAVENILPLLNKEVRNLNFNYQKVLTGKTKPLPRSEECLTLIPKTFKIIESALYIRKYFNELNQAKTTTTEVVNFIRDQFKKALNDTMWSEQDKAKAIEKLTSLYVYVGFPDEILHDEILLSFFKNVEINEDCFLQSSLDLKNFQTEFEFNRLHEPVNRTDWIDFSTSLTDINAFYELESNTIRLHAAILQGNFINANYPQYINFGAIGQIIGHEFSHGFDNQGRQYNKDGSLENWWSDVAEQDFAEKKRCLVEQFNNFTVLGEKINGEISVGENMADLGGRKISYLAYQNWSKSLDKEEPGLPGLNYTNNQLFWIASASVWCSNWKEELLKHIIATDPHMPDELRINGPMPNLETFSKDFHCSVGTNMNPKQKCTPW